MRLDVKIHYSDLDRVLTQKGYAYFRKGHYNMNIIGIRSNNTTSNNLFCDYIVLEYFDNDGNKNHFMYSATTNPGLHYLLNPLSNDGCAIVVPGQYRAAYTFGLHQKKYRALVQNRPIKVYRDNTLDNIFDKTTIQEGMFGINIHKAGADSKYVDKWSAGCQVFKRSTDFSDFMSRLDLQTYAGLGDKFTYTLIEENDLDYD